MENIIEYISWVEEQYKMEIGKLKVELSDLPEGYLVRRTRDGHARYAQMINQREKGITRNHELIQKLSRKRYIQKYLNRLNLNLKEVQRLKLYDLSFESIYQTLPHAYQILPEVTFLNIKETQWKNQQYNKCDKNPENLTIITNSGIVVRSKSEQQIANTLDQYNITFRYEPELKLGGQTIYPDFEIIHPKSSEIKYWEHFGGIGDHQYESSMVKKLNLYQQHYIFPGRDLICSYESDTRDSRKIHNLIKTHLH